MFWELGTDFYQSCTSFPTIINQAFPGMLYAAKVAKTPFFTPKGPDVLCITLSAPGALEGDTIVASVDVSDSVRVVHANDGNTLFGTGGQDVDTVELYINCHPFTSTCVTAASVQVSSTGTTATGVALPFSAPAGEGEHTIYIRAKDSAGYEGAVTARSFVTCPAGGCPFTATPTKIPTKFPTNSPSTTGGSPGPEPVCDNTCSGCNSKAECKAQGCQWKGTCRPQNLFG